MDVCLDSTPGYRLRVYQYPSGVVEAISSFVPVLRTGAASVFVERSVAEVDARAADNVRRAVARARASVRRLCLAAGVDRLLTLTYRRNETDLDAAWQDFARFVRQMRGHMPGWRYVAVAERQVRGAVHFHLGVVGWQNVGLLRVVWRSVAGDGNIDVTASRSGLSPGARAAGCAKYLSKYMLKACDIERGDGHRYRASHIRLPFVSFRLNVGTWAEAASATLLAVTTLGALVHGSCYDAGYGLTWAVGWSDVSP